LLEVQARVRLSLIAAFQVELVGLRIVGAILGEQSLLFATELFAKP